MALAISDNAAVRVMTNHRYSHLMVNKMKNQKPPLIKLPFDGRGLQILSAWNIVRTIRKIVMGV